MRYAKSDKITSKEQTLTVGDLVRVHQKIYEEEKTRIQVFEGTLIAVKNRGENRTITVRKMSYDKVAVERIWPLDSPHIDHIEVKKKGDYRRAKLYFLRDKVN
ncbi:50S ribosomal protein L19 [Candidatus Gottesmanbacteria bacterium]|nr:50S ribosomal protein L19 [Candidatus Gottesmanbacteria bacterium]